MKEGLEKNGMIGWQFNTIGVSDAITMSNQGECLGHTNFSLLLRGLLDSLADLQIIGMRFSLQSRDIIADSVETTTCAQHHDANISIPGCDKNMPGCESVQPTHHVHVTNMTQVSWLWLAIIDPRCRNSNYLNLRILCD